LLEFLEYGGSLLSVIGAITVASNSKYSKWGFVVFAVSNFLLGGWAYLTDAVGVLLMSLSFLCINMYGIIKWFRH